MSKLELPNYNEAQAFTGDLEQLPAGGYVCRILNTRIDDWKSGNGQSLVLQIDIAEGDYAGFFKKQYDANTNADKKWNNGGLFRQNIPNPSTDYYQKSLSYFKGVITAIENSNQGFTWNMDTATLKDKLIGVLFRREEYRKQDGTTAWAVRAEFARSVDKIRKGEFKILDDKPLQQNSNNAGYSPIAESVDDDDDLPF